jgi:uncharacterized protein (TIGR03435 family)
LIRSSILGAGLLLLVCHGAAQRPSFEVVSIKANHSGSSNGGLGPRGSRLLATNVNLNTLLMYAYSPPGGRILDAQILGEPNWARTERFDIEAKAEGDARIMPGEQTRAMLRSLLEDSFQLKVHRETRDLPVYSLVLAKNGPKLSADQTPPDPRQSSISFATKGDQLSPLPRGAQRMVTGPTTTVLTGTAISVSNLVALLQSKSDRILIDKTGFTGLLDVQLIFGPDLTVDANRAGTVEPAEPGADSAPSLFTAIQDIGLKLEPGKAPLEVLVIDSVQRPPQN